MARGAWRATIHRVAKSQTGWKRLSRYRPLAPQHHPFPSVYFTAAMTLFTWAIIFPRTSGSMRTGAVNTLFTAVLGAGPQPSVMAIIVRSYRGGT